MRDWLGESQCRETLAYIHIKETISSIFKYLRNTPPAPSGFILNLNTRFLFFILKLFLNFLSLRDQLLRDIIKYLSINNAAETLCLF